MAVTIRNKQTEAEIREVGRETGEGPSALIARLVSDEKKRLTEVEKLELARRRHVMRELLAMLPDLTEGQKVFVRAVKREMVKYADPNRQGYPHNLLEQMESFTRTIGDLHNSYFDGGMRKVSDCLYNRWKVLYEETKKLAASGADTKPAWVDVIKTEQTDMPAFFDA